MVWSCNFRCTHAGVPALCVCSQTCLQRKLVVAGGEKRSDCLLPGIFWKQVLRLQGYTLRVSPMFLQLCYVLELRRGSLEKALLTWRGNGLCCCAAWISPWWLFPKGLCCRQWKQWLCICSYQIHVKWSSSNGKGKPKIVENVTPAVLSPLEGGTCLSKRCFLQFHL